MCEDPAPKKNVRLGRSLLAGETSLPEIRELTKRFSDARRLFGDDMMDGCEYDVQVVDGDLSVAGSLATWEHDLVGLVVTGSLSVKGTFADTGDPASGVFVYGDMTAARVVTTGSLGVGGSLVATEAVVGFYNDYGASIVGDLRAPLFCPENHFFSIGGDLLVEAVVGEGAEHRVPSHLAGRVLQRVPRSLRSVLIDDVVRCRTDGSEGLDAEALRRRVCAGRLVLRDGQGP